MQNGSRPWRRRCEWQSSSRASAASLEAPGLALRLCIPSLRRSTPPNPPASASSAHRLPQPPSVTPPFWAIFNCPLRPPTPTQGPTPSRTSLAFHALPRKLLHPPLSGDALLVRCLHLMLHDVMGLTRGDRAPPSPRASAFVWQFVSV